MKHAGDRETAAAVAALRRGSWTDWGLNVTADREAELTTRFTRAAAHMREAQDAAIEGQATDLAASLRELRHRVTELARAAGAVLTGHGRSPELAELIERLGVIAADPTASEQLDRAVLRPIEPDSVEPFAHVGATLDQHADPRQPIAPDARSSRAISRPLVDTAVERRRRRQILDDAEKAWRTVAHELSRAERSLAATQHAVDLAAAALAQAQDGLQLAERRRTEAAIRRDDLLHEMAGHEVTLAAARSALDAILG